MEFERRCLSRACELKKPETRRGDGVNGNDNDVATSAFNVPTVTLAAFLGKVLDALLSKDLGRNGLAG